MSSSRSIIAQPLTAHAFAAFGDVIEDPSSSTGHDSSAVTANQGSALKYPNISTPVSAYPASATASTRITSSLYVCSPRQPLPSSHHEASRHERAFSQSWRAPLQYELNLLERHPYTTQTFLPLSSPDPSEESAYLVIVAPSRPSGETARTSTSGQQLSAPPDLSRIRAFVATGAQGVTYGVGTWHSPMMALGDKSLAFYVLQYTNGIASDDCQEMDQLGPFTIEVPALRASERARL